MHEINFAGLRMRSFSLLIPCPGVTENSQQPIKTPDIHWNPDSLGMMLRPVSFNTSTGCSCKCHILRGLNPNIKIFMVVFCSLYLFLSDKAR